jgi:hypothetical protein
MRYVSSVERIGIAKGRQEGLQKEIQEGLVLGEAQMLSLLLNHRLGELPDATLNRVMSAGEEQLKKWLINAIAAPT